MIYKSVISPSKTYLSGHKSPNRGIGRIFLHKDPDILTLKTGTETLVIQAPGHSFKNGDEVIFERINDTFYISKNNSSEAKEPNIPGSDIYYKQNIIESLPLPETLQTLSTSIEKNVENTALISKYIQQLTTIIETIPSLEHSSEIRDFINTLKQSDVQPSPEHLKKLLDLLSKLMTSIPQSGRDQIYQTQLLSILDKTISEGIYQFNTIDSALQFLDCNDKSNIEMYLKSLIENDGCISIRVFNSGEKSSCAQILNNSVLDNELRSLLKKNAPEILKKLPVSVFQNFIKETGHLDASMIKLLSQLPITQNDTSLQNIRTSKPQNDAVILHWLLTVNECRECAGELAKRIPSSSLDTITEALSTILQKDKSQTLSLDDIGLNISKGLPENASAAFANRIRKLGYTLEHNLLTDTPLTPTLKSDLLNLISTSHNNDFESAFPLSPNTLQRPDHSAISKIISNLQDFLTQLKITSRDESLFPNTNTTLSVTTEQNIKNIMNDIVNSFAHIYPPATTPPAQHSMQSSEQHTQPLQFPENSELHSNQPRILTMAIDSITTLLKITEAYSGFEAIRKTILELQSEFESFISSLENKITSTETISEKYPEENSILNSFNQKKAEHPDGLEKLHPTLKEMLISSRQDQKPIETLVHRLESLQLLARPVTTQDGSGHILALPVKIGQEWSEVTLRMVKKEKPGNSTSSSSKHYTVYLDVAPSYLGTIHAMLSYEKNHPLSIKMEFEKKEVTSWFSSNVEKLRHTLIDNNIPVFNIELKTIQPITEPTKKVNISDNQNNIDIQI